MTNAWRFAAVLAAAVAIGACDNSPTAPALFTTETFTGTVVREGLSSHTFITGQVSPVVLRVTSLAPLVGMGLALGTPAFTSSGEVCSITVGQAAVQQGDTFQVQLEPATYCVMMFDIGNVAESSTVAYSVTVQHR
jgi:hypothetical protein